MRLQPLGEAIEIILECAERDVLVLLARAFADRAPDVRIAFRCEREGRAALADVEPELVVKGPRDDQVRDDEVNQQNPGDLYVRLQITIGTNAVIVGATGWGSDAKHEPAKANDVTAAIQRLVV